MCTDIVSTVKKSVMDLDARGKRQIFNALLWELTRGKQQQYDYISSYLKNCNCCCTSRGKNNNVFLADDQYNQFVAEFGQGIVDKAIDQLSDKLLTGYKTTRHQTACRVFCEAQQRYEAKHNNKSNQQPNDGGNLGRMARL